jgi:hypothetical protein
MKYALASAFGYAVGVILTLILISAHTGRPIF